MKTILVDMVIAILVVVGLVVLGNVLAIVSAELGLG